MKKILALVLALVMLVAMVACASKDTTADKTPADTTPADTTPADTTTEDTTPADTSADTEASELKVGVFYYTFADTYIASVRTAMDAELTNLGVSFNNFDGNNNQTTQNEQIQTAVTDAEAEIVVSLCRNLLAQSVQFTLCWNENGQLVRHLVRDLDELIAL